MNKVDTYIQKHPNWQGELTILRKIFAKTELEEDLKWGAPSYQLNKKIVAGMVGFKNHLGLWFHQGVFLADPKNKLINAQEGKTKALRQWRFEKGEKIDEDLVLAYIQEAIQNCKEGKEVKPKRKTELIIPPLLKEALKEKETAAAFKKLTPGRKKEYAAYITEAKQQTTKEKRVQKIIPMILTGLGLNDKYK